MSIFNQNPIGPPREAEAEAKERAARSADNRSREERDLAEQTARVEARAAERHVARQEREERVRLAADGLAARRRAARAACPPVPPAPYLEDDDEEEEDWGGWRS